MTGVSSARPAGVDVTVSDGGIDVRAALPSSTAKPTAPAPPQAQQVASTAQLQATLTPQETEALAQRFVDLPRSSPVGTYGRAGRAAAAPVLAQQGRLIDITG